eukprot:jgi/Chrzof1/7809/Cz02g37110.t1
MSLRLQPSNILVMGDGPQQGVVKIADFGLARFFQSPVRPLSDNGVVVTIWYRAPELLLGGKHYTRAVDMWAAGCIFAELITLRPLFQGQERKQTGAPFQLDQLDRIFRVFGHPSTRTWSHLEHLHHWHDNTENIRVKRPEWASNRLAEHLTDVCRHMTDTFRAAGNMVATPRQTNAAIALMQQMLEYDPLKRITAEDALRHEYFQEDPKPGPNAFVYGTTPVVVYPRRGRHNVPGAHVPPQDPHAPQGTNIVGATSAPGNVQAAVMPGPIANPITAGGAGRAQAHGQHGAYAYGQYGSSQHHRGSAAAGGMADAHGLPSSQQRGGAGGNYPAAAAGANRKRKLDGSHHSQHRSSGR